MLFSAQELIYRDTGAFSKIVLDYIEGAPQLQPFYAFAPTHEGLSEAIKAKQKQAVDRETLVRVLTDQYKYKEDCDAVHQNIEALLSPQTFTICTAHQPNLFTGPLYFIYKILHAIRLADELNKAHASYRFVPVYYMGSEDADKEELAHTFFNGAKKEWHTKQTGAVGRMMIDKEVTRLLDELSGEISVQPYGTEIVKMLHECYASGKSIQSATFDFVHQLFKRFGLVVLIADHEDLKKLLLPLFEDDLFRQVPSKIVGETGRRLAQQYNVQAQPRAINLFYLSEGIRNRIDGDDAGFVVHDTDIRFTHEELKTELQHHPERFSPNVILRGIYQETILPNIAFIGGGGELAYWLQLKDLFQHYAVPFPVLVLRNSFLIVDQKRAQILQKTNLSILLSFQPTLKILNSLLEKKGNLPHLNGELIQLTGLYEDLKKLAVQADSTLEQHVEALKVKSIQQLQVLETKMARAERKKHTALQAQIAGIKQTLFPNNGLQERTENFAPFYAKWGSDFIDELLNNSLTLEQKFVVLTEV